jgi:hypothetical protein
MQTLQNRPNPRGAIEQAFINLWDVSRAYLTRKDEIERALPFQSLVWQILVIDDFKI